MLKHIPPSLSPSLMKILMEMGHTDEIVLGDSNFPVYTHARQVVECHGFSISTLLDDILAFFPLDYLGEAPAAVIAVPGDIILEDPAYDEYQAIIDTHNGKKTRIEYMAREDFYHRASQAYAVVASGERRRFANIILRKGVV